MKATFIVLQKVLVNHFYKINAGLFMFLFYVLFGLPNNVAGFHIAIAALIIKNQLLLLMVFGLWLLYNFKCIDYIVKQIKAPQQLFLYNLQNISNKKKYFYLSYVQFMVYLPVIAYSIFLLTIALKNHSCLVIAEIIIFVLMMLLITPLLYAKTLQHQLSEIKLNAFNSSIRIPKTIITIPLFYIWQNRKQMLLITKFFSLLFLVVFIKTYQPDHYDIRPVLLCLLLCAISNCTIVFEIKKFEDESLSFAKNFPLSIIRRFTNLLLMYIILLLPELVFIWRAYPLHFHLTDYPQLAILSVSLLVLLHVSLFTDNIKMDAFVKIVFAIAMILFFIILYNPGIFLPLFILIISFVLFRSYFYAFEKE